MGWLLAFASINLTVVNPVKKAFSDFSMTDVFYEIQNSSGVKEINNDIVLVDMTELYDRRKIADCMTNINKCNPKVLVVDLIFERPSYDEGENEYLINAVSSLDNAMFSCKLTDYDYINDRFRKVRRSFFSYEGDGGTENRVRLNRDFQQCDIGRRLRLHKKILAERTHQQQRDLLAAIHGGMQIHKH